MPEPTDPDNDDEVNAALDALPDVAARFRGVLGGGAPGSCPCGKAADAHWDQLRDNASMN